METQNCRPESGASSPDPIAGVRLWLVLPLAIVATVVALILIGPSPPPDLEKKAVGVAVLAVIVVWWLSAVDGATRRAGFRLSTPSVGAVLKQSLKVAVGGILTTLVWVLAKHALGLSRVGLVTAPSVAASEPTPQSLGFIVFEVALLAPVAEEMLFRGALFRKWRLRFGPGKAAVLTSVLFSLAHANPASVALFALSLAVLYTTTRTIWAPVAAHVANNLFGVALVNCVPLVPVPILQAAASWPLQLASLVPGLLGAWWLVRYLRRGWHTLGDPVHGEPAPVATLVSAEG